MKFEFAAAAGQVCQRSSLPLRDWPRRDIAPGHQHVDGFESGDRRLHDRCGPFGTPGQQGGNAAGGERNKQDNDTRGFHTLHFPL